MGWFSKDERKEIWDHDIQWPIGDIEAAHKIRDICRSASDSAEKVAAFAGRPDNKKHKYESERYQRAARTAMEPISETGIAMIGTIAARQLCRKISTTTATSTIASISVRCTAQIDSEI